MNATAHPGARLWDVTKPTLLALGGSTTPHSASERALRLAVDATGLEVTSITGRALMLPIYDTETRERTPEAHALIEAARRADGILIASPGYHGGVSGMVKNALDYLEDLRHDERPYLEGRVVGLIGVAHGWQTAVGTLAQLRDVVHSLRGWPTPLGVAINDSAGLIGADAAHSDPHVVGQLQTLGRQVAETAARLAH